MRILALLALPVCMAVAAADDTQSPGTLADQLVQNFRQLMLTHWAQPGRLTRERASAGQYLFFQNRLVAARLVDRAAAEPAACTALMDHMQATPQWRSVDRLALGGVMAELDARLAADNPCLARIRVERAALASVRAFYDREISAALRGTGTAALSGRPEWNDYIAFLKRRREAGELETELEPLPAQRPGNAGERKPGAILAEQDEWFDGGLPPRTILLTFDDGPHRTYTARVLDILKRYEIKAVFFQVGQNLAGPSGAASSTVRDPALISRMLEEGHSIANHTYTHPLLPRLDELAVTDEIDRTEAMLNLAAGDHPGRARLFRPPYGARNDLVLSDTSQRGLRSVIWNIDSRDWADPIPRSIAQRVIDEAQREGRGIVLFHDIHLRSVEALQPTIDGLLKLGFRFARLENGRLAVKPE